MWSSNCLSNRFDAALTCLISTVFWHEVVRFLIESFLLCLELRLIHCVHLYSAVANSERKVIVSLRCTILFFMLKTVSRVHSSEKVLSIKKSLSILNKLFFLRDLAEVRTQDPLLKREMLYQLSYQILRVCGCKYSRLICISKRKITFFLICWNASTYGLLAK